MIHWYWSQSILQKPLDEYPRDERQSCNQDDQHHRIHAYDPSLADKARAMLRVIRAYEVRVTEGVVARRVARAAVATTHLNRGHRLCLEARTARRLHLRLGEKSLLRIGLLVGSTKLFL